MDNEQNPNVCNILYRLRFADLPPQCYLNRIKWSKIIVSFGEECFVPQAKEKRDCNWSIIHLTTIKL